MREFDGLAVLEERGNGRWEMEAKAKEMPRSGGVRTYELWTRGKNKALAFSLQTATY